VTLPNAGGAVKPMSVFPLAAPRPLFHNRPQLPGAGSISLRRCHAAGSPINFGGLERRLDRARMPTTQRADYHKWVRFYLDFCHKYGQPPASPTSLGPFLTKLASKGQSVVQRNQASVAVRLHIRPAGPQAATP